MSIMCLISISIFKVKILTVQKFEKKFFITARTILNSLWLTYNTFLLKISKLIWLKLIQKLILLLKVSYFQLIAEIKKIGLKKNGIWENKLLSMIPELPRKIFKVLKRIQIKLNIISDQLTNHYLQNYTINLNTMKLDSSTLSIVWEIQIQH